MTKLHGRWGWMCKVSSSSFQLATSKPVLHFTKNICPVHYNIHWYLVLISAVISRQIQRGVKKGLLANKQSLLQLYNSSRSKISGGILFVPSCTITDRQKNVHWRIITILRHSSLDSCLVPDIFTNRVKTTCNLALLEYLLNVINAKAHIRFSTYVNCCFKKWNFKHWRVTPNKVTL